MALTTITSGSNATVAVTAQQYILLSNASTATARLEYTSGTDSGKIIEWSHNGRQVYGPLTAGNVKVSAISGNVGYEVSSTPDIDVTGWYSTAASSGGVTHLGAVADESAMVALSTAVVGSMCTRTDTGSIWILTTGTYETAGNWQDTGNAATTWSTVVETGTSRTLAASDNYKTILFTNVGAITVNVPTDADGIRCQFVWLAGAGTITVDPGTSVTINGDTANITLSAAAGGVELIPTGTSNTFYLTGAVGDLVLADITDASTAGKAMAAATYTRVICVDVSGDESTALTTGTSKRVFRMPYAMTVTKVKATVSTASSSGDPAVDINEGGVSILSTTLTIDANEKTSDTAATPAVISDSALADDAEISIDVDTAGTGTKGLKVYIMGY